MPKMRLANRRSSNMGEPTRNSHQTKKASSKTTATAPTITGADCQPRPLPLPTTSSSINRNTPDTAAPVQSKDVPCPRRYCPAPAPRSNTNQDRASTRHPVGTLIKNTHCQPSQATRKPPMAGPAMAPSPTMLRWVPRALPRSESGNAAIIMPMPQPCTMPAPMPCNTRIAISAPRVGENVAPREPTTKIAVPII